MRFAALAVAQLVAPNRFFLTSSEVMAARNGNPRHSLSLYSNSTVKYWANGATFMPRLKALIDGAGAGDFVYATFFEMDPDVMLDPDPMDLLASDRSRLKYVLAAAAARGVRVRILYTLGGIQAAAGSTGTCDRLNALLNDPLCCVPDMRHGHAMRGSNHVKMWAIAHGAELTAFVGGMDVADTRWDTAAHDTSDPRWRMQPLDWRGFAWHDAMYELRGGAAADLLTIFRQRWNDPVAPRPLADLLPPLPAFTPAPVLGGVPVQVVETLSCAGAMGDRVNAPLFQGFAPDGEFTYAAAWFKALKQARTYVYVADQFMWFDEAMQALVDAAERVEAVIVVTNTGLVREQVRLPWADQPAYQAALQHYQYQALLAALDARDPTGALRAKVHLTSLFQQGEERAAKTQIYDHEKTLLIDDEFALVGSTGVERTGFTNDHEVSIGIFDPPTVAALRRAMFAEFLLLDADSPVLADPRDAVREWRRQLADGTQRVRTYEPQDKVGWGIQGAMARAMYDFLEPDGRCKDQQHRYQWAAATHAGTDAVLEDLRNMVFNDLIV